MEIYSQDVCVRERERKKSKYKVEGKFNLHYKIK